MAKKPFQTGTLVRYTTKFLRQIGSVTGPIDGLVLGTGPIGNLVAWSDGTSMVVNPYNLQRTKKQLSEAEKRSLVAAERNRLPQTMEGYTKEEVEEIAVHYDGKMSNPTFEEFEEFEEEVEDRAEDQDFVVYQKGDRWGVNRIGGRGLGLFDSQKKMEKALETAMKKEGYYPNVWWEYERGDPTDLYEFEYRMKANPRKSRRTSKKKAAKKRPARRRGKKTTTTVTNPSRAAAKRRCMR